MIEGWHNDTYLILFEPPQEQTLFTQRYGIPAYLPGHTVIGLWGWDDFIIRDEKGAHFTVPTIPLAPEFLQPFPTKINPSILRPDARFTGRIKWHKQPIIFGGDPKPGENLAWIPLDPHVEMVAWWNKTYHSVKTRNHPGK
ncbi:MAG TPA: hypothetical protein VG733_08165 [Chthoniobacteraceae bacterium]|nr:hypothetical protein [Chthoniobacteraceae bacterium]